MTKSSIELALLLTWLSCCAIYLAIARTFLRGAPQDMPQVLMLSLLAALHGTCWVGMLTVLRCVFGKGVRQLEPGMWLMGSLGAVLMGDLIVGALPEDFVIRKPSLTLAVSCLAFSLPTLARRLETRWKVLFVGLMSISLLPLVIRWQEWINAPTYNHPNLILSATFSLVCLAIVRDYFLGVRRSWLHWTGIGCLVLWAVPRVY